jgi:hypothetical protein
VTAFDAYGNVATGYLGTVRFESNDTRAVLPAKYTFTSANAGQHVCWATFKTSGSQAIVAKDTVTSSIDGAQTGINVNPASATNFTVTGYPSPTTAGAWHSLNVTVLDAYGNVATGYVGTVHFTSSDAKAVLPASYTFTSGNAGHRIFWAAFKTAGAQTITATDTVNAGITGQASVTVVANAARTLQFSNLPGSVVAGVAQTFTLTAKDAFGNVATSYGGTVHFTSSDPQAVVPANYTFAGSDAGVHVFTNGLAFRTTGEQSFTATDTAHSALTVTQINILVTAAPAKVMAIIRVPSTSPAVAGGALTVTAQPSVYAGPQVFAATFNPSGAQAAAATDSSPPVEAAPSSILLRRARVLDRYFAETELIEYPASIFPC